DPHSIRPLSDAILTGGADLLQHRQEIPAELVRVLAHREMAELAHHRHLRARDLRSGAPRVVWRAGIIILTGQQIERTTGGIDAGDLGAQSAVDPIEMEVSLEHAGTALLVHPECLVPRRLRTLRGDQPGDQRRADLPAMDVGTVEPGRVVPGCLEI